MCSPLRLHRWNQTRNMGTKLVLTVEIMVSLCRDSYHVEAVFESECTIRLYTLGKTKLALSMSKSQSLKGFVQSGGTLTPRAWPFEPQPQDGDAENKTSFLLESCQAN